MEGHNSRFNCLQFDQAIEFILTLIAAGGKLEGTSVSFDTSNVSDAGSVAVGKGTTQAVLEAIIKNAVSKVEFIEDESKLRITRLDGTHRDIGISIPSSAADVSYQNNTEQTSATNVQSAITDLFTKIENIKPIGGSGVTPEQIQQAIQDWLDAHPEATTSVPDGSITLAKLATDVKTAINNAGKIASVEVSCNIEERAEEYINYELNISAKDKDGKVVSSRYGFLLIPVVSEDGAGLMTEAMLQTLDRLESSATIDVTVVSNASDVKIKRSVVHGPAKEFSLPAATSEKAGVMTAEDKSKLETAVQKAEDLSRLVETFIPLGQANIYLQQNARGNYTLVVTPSSGEGGGGEGGGDTPTPEPPATGVVEFEDELVEQIVLEHYDADGDGQITIDELKLVTAL